MKTLFNTILYTGLFFNSCSKDNKTPTGPNEPETGYTLETNVYEIQEGEVSGYNSETGTVTFTNTPTQEIGDIILNNNLTEQTPYGFLRKIESISNNTAETSVSTLNEAIENCYIQENFSLVPQGPFQRPGNFNFNIPIDVVLYDQDGNLSTTDDQATLNGHLAFNTEITDFTLDADLGGLNQFTFNTSSEESFNMSYTSNTTSIEISEEVNIVSIICQPVYITPFVLVPRININAKAEGTLSNVEAEISQEANLETELSYENGNWNTGSNFSNEFNFETPTFSSEAELKISVGPEIQLLAYDLAGAYIGTNGFLRAEVSPTEDPWWTLCGGLETIVGATLQAFGWPIADYSIPLFGHEQILAQSEEEPGPENGRIAFTSNRDGNNEIYVMDADGSNQVNVSNNPSADGSPLWSPDRSSILFLSLRDDNSEIYVMDADGGNQMRLTNNQTSDVSPLWSPDGSRIVFRHTVDNSNCNEIYVMDADGGNQMRLTNNSSCDNNPSWSPDGGRIVFDCNRDSNSEIYVMDADGSNQVNVSNNPSADAFPLLSPDGSSILFVSNRDGNNEIYVMDADGSNQVNVSNNPSADVGPLWSPDGSRIVFISRRNGNYDEIYVMDADGSNQVNVSNNPSTNASPSWSPDGGRIVFESHRDNNYEIYVMDADGSNQMRLTNNQGRDEDPSWNTE